MMRAKRAAPKKAKRTAKGEPQTPPQPVGRPTAYVPEYAAEAKELCDQGATNPELAHHFGVATRTITDWRNAHPEFREAVGLGKDAADERVVRSLYERALGYEDDDGRRIPGDTTACIFWLKNRRKEWRDRNQHEMSGPDGGPIKIEGTMSDLEAARLIARVLLKARAAQEQPRDEPPASEDTSSDADGKSEPEPA